MKLGRRRVGKSTGVFGSGVLKFALTISPTLGAEILTNPSLEAPYASGLANGWTKNNSPTVTQESSVVHAGSSSQKMVCSNNSDGVYQFKNASLTAGQWVFMSAWGSKLSGGNFSVICILNNSSGGNLLIPDSTWTQSLRSGRYISNSTGVWARQNTATAATGFVDDASLKVISTTSMFGQHRFSTVSGDVCVSAKVGMVLDTAIGFWINVDDPANPTNGVACYVDNVSVFLEKLVNGTWTQVAKVAQVWNPAYVLRLVKSGSTYKVFVNDVAITGSPFTISDASVINNINHLQFSTYALNQFYNFKVIDLNGNSTLKLTVIGDSISNNTTPTNWHTYFSPIFNYGNCTLTNRAVWGSTITAQSASNLATQAVAAASDNADVIVVELGTNSDGSNDVSAAYISGINALKSSNPNARIYAIGIFDRTDMTGVVAKRALIASLCSGLGIQYIDTSGWISAATDLLDNVHPNATGASKIAQRLFGVLYK